MERSSSSQSSQKKRNPTFSQSTEFLRKVDVPSRTRSSTTPSSSVSPPPNNNVELPTVAPRASSFVSKRRSPIPSPVRPRSLEAERPAEAGLEVVLSKVEGLREAMERGAEDFKEETKRLRREMRDAAQKGEEGLEDAITGLRVRHQTSSYSKLDDSLCSALSLIPRKS